MAKTDQELVVATLGGDPHAFEQIIERYQRSVFNIVYHYLGRRNEVEDVAQEVFLKVFRSLARYDRSRPIQAWISRIAVNSCLDELRRARHRNLKLFSDLNDEEQGRLDRFYHRFRQGSQLSEGEAEDLFLLLQKLMQRLPKKDRMAFVLREVEGLDYLDIAQAMGATQLAVRIRVSRSRKKLLEALGQVCPKGGGGR
ncbi:MAG: RNA polymerase sigma factor [Acidobacteriota bacterium]